MEITPAYMEKPKRKSKETNSRLNSILTYLGVKPTLIEFTVDASLETCMSRLTSTAQIQTYFGYLLNRVAVEVKLYQTDDGHCRFSLRKYQRRGPEVEIIGHLEQLSTEKTLMTGSVEMQGFLTEIMLATVAIILGVLFLFSLLLSSAFPFNLLLDLSLLAMLAAIIANIAEDRRMLIRFFGNALTAPKPVEIKKNNN